MPCNCRQEAGAHNHLGDVSLKDGLFGFGTPLNDSIDLSFIQMWNARSSSQQARRVFDPKTQDNNVPLCSDEDPELLILLPLSSICKLKGISILGPMNDFAPSQVKIFANPAEVLGFDSVRRLKPQEEILLAQVSGEDRVVYKLNAINFATVSSLALYFDHSFSEEETHLLRVDLYGENSGRSSTQQVAKNVVYESRANPADHPVRETHKNFFTPSA
ncbi:unnamed protein product [Phytomonas sp. Hart1]|nr:unnamed protein product [Phytomonas sp. Hart1]|eukprot:CCW66648.1 unnamed protein product [Phytomonas sp. isolate Hart1]